MTAESHIKPAIKIDQRKDRTRSSEATQEGRDPSSSKMVTRSDFDRLRKAKPSPPSQALSKQSSKKMMAEDISDAESEEDEEVTLDEEEVATRDAGQLSSLDELLVNTPEKRLKLRMKQAKSVEKAAEKHAYNDDALWQSVRLRQEVLALAKLHAFSLKVTASVSEEDVQTPVPSLLAKAHLELAEAYRKLECWAQTIDHCKQALSISPPLDVQQLIQKANGFIGDTYIEMSPSKPLSALPFLYAASGCTEIEDANMDSGIKLSIARCHLLLGDAKLKEAGAVRNSLVIIEQRISTLLQKEEQRNTASVLSTRPAKKGGKLEDTRLNEAYRELNAESAFESSLLAEARENLNISSDAVMEVITKEEDRLRALYTKLASDIKDATQRQEYIDKSKQQPVVQVLWALACEILFKMACVESFVGDFKAQLRNLQEIKSAKESYECIPPSLYSSCLKEEGAALLKLACNANDEDEDEETKEERKESNLEKALDTYHALLDFQSETFSEDEAMQATTRAETLKFIGNVYFAKSQWERAKKSYSEALEIFTEQLGPSHNFVQDLDLRLQDIEQFAT